MVRPSTAGIIIALMKADVTLAPQFHHINDVESIRDTFNDQGAVFINECDEQSLITLAKQLGRIAKPRNEVGTGTGVSNIRCAPGLEGKGYSSEGWCLLIK